MKKSINKKFGFAICLVMIIAFAGCTPTANTPEENQTEQEEPKGPAYTITAQEGYENTITIDEAAKTITLQPADEKISYTITGSFEGQIITKTNNTKIILNNANLKNTEGKAAIYSEVKVKIAANKDSDNTITVTGAADATYGKAAVYTKDNIEIGGEGKLTVTCENAHGVKADKIELKGSGNYTFDGGADNSAVNCNDFVVTNDSDTGDPRTFVTTFKNSRNGIKADYTITIASGTFNFIDITETAIKTGEEPKKNKKGEITKTPAITLNGGTFNFQLPSGATKYFTIENGFTKADAVVGDFE